MAEVAAAVYESVPPAKRRHAAMFAIADAIDAFSKEVRGWRHLENRGTPRSTRGRSRTPPGVYPTFILLVTLASYDGNILLLSATGAILQPGILVVTGLFSVAGAGAWFLASRYYRVTHRAADPCIAAEFRRALIMSTVFVVAACVAGTILGTVLTLHVLRYFGMAAILVVGVCIMTCHDVPACRLRRRAIPIPSLLIASGFLGEIAYQVVTIASGGTWRAAAPDLGTVVHGALAGVAIAVIAWASIYLATLLPVERHLNRQAFGFFGGLTVTMIAMHVGGLPVSSMLFSPLVASYGLVLIFGTGVLIAAAVLRWTGISGWEA